ncbi:MAG: ATP-dependent DNA helicase RecG [Candidatus Midichloriaceae bacterium]|jgi:ATP-dependent DNA helicase RecG
MNIKNEDLINYLNKDVSTLLGIGDKRLSLFKKMGIRRFKDLLFHIPINYIDRSLSPKIFDIEDGDIVTLKVIVSEIKLKGNYRSRIPSKILCKNDTGFITLLYFNNIPPYIKQLYQIDNEIIISGKITIQNSAYTIVHPDIAVNSNEQYKVPKLESVYSKVEGLTSKLLAYLVNTVITNSPINQEWLTNDVLSAHAWYSFMDSLKILHNPKNINQSSFAKARERLAFDELLSQQTSLRIFRNKMKKEKTKLNSTGKLKQEFLENFKFTLSAEQKHSVDSITEDQLSDQKMVRIVMGDVGCGKTLVGLCAALNAIEGKKQVAFMVPTEILAQQHYKNITKYVENFDINVELLVSNIKSAAKKKVLSDLSEGKIDILIGTHALFQEKVIFQSLGLVIIDEQHRFGVKQRIDLLEKGTNVDLLMLSATPIPRTISMLNYGDMDVSIIKEKPISNVEIETKILSISKVETLIERIKLLVEKNHRVYWVCPLIEESEKLQLAHVEESFSRISKSLGDKVGMIHGRMKFEERDKVMEEFKNGTKSVLVATTVIEVGIDVPEATTIVIENAERFGLSQLHQLRGRVGRGTEKSYCILVHGEKLSLESKKRLAILKKYSDGFKIAEKDLELRGSGDYLGFRQSGAATFHFFDVLKDGDMLNMVDHYINNNLLTTNKSDQNFLKIFDSAIKISENNPCIT